MSFETGPIQTLPLELRRPCHVRVDGRRLWGTVIGANMGGPGTTIVAYLIRLDDGAEIEARPADVTPAAELDVVPRPAPSSGSFPQTLRPVLGRYVLPEMQGDGSLRWLVLRDAGAASLLDGGPLFLAESIHASREEAERALGAGG